MKTIAQISTPLGSGGISIIRLSGDNALNIATNIFSTKNMTYISNVGKQNFMFG